MDVIGHKQSMAYLQVLKQRETLLGWCLPQGGSELKHNANHNTLPRWL